MAGGGWSLGRDLRTRVPGRTHQKRKEWRDLLGSPDLGSKPPRGQWAKGPQGMATDPNGLMGKDGSRPLDPQPLSSGRSMSSLPTTAPWLPGQLGKHHASREPKPSPHPTKPPDACRKGKAGYPLPGKEEGERQSQTVLFFSISFSKDSPSLSYSGPGRSRGAGKTFRWQGGPRQPRPADRKTLPF